MSHVTGHCSESWRMDVEDVFALSPRILSQARREFYFENPDHEIIMALI